MEYSSMFRKNGRTRTLEVIENVKDAEKKDKESKDEEKDSEAENSVKEEKDVQKDS